MPLRLLLHLDASFTMTPHTPTPRATKSQFWGNCETVSGGSFEKTAKTFDARRMSSLHAEALDTVPPRLPKTLDARPSSVKFPRP